MSGSWSLLFGVQWWTLWLYLRDMQAWDSNPDTNAPAQQQQEGMPSERNALPPLDAGA